MCTESGKIVKLTMLLAILFISVGGVPSVFAGKITDPLVLEKLEWWRDLKFGLLVCWAFEVQWGCESSSPMYPGPVGQKHRDRMKQWEECGKDFARFRKAFFDLNKPKAVCPKCGKDQAESPKYVAPKPEPKPPEPEETELISDIDLEDDDSAGDSGMESFEELEERLNEGDEDEQQM